MPKGGARDWSPCEGSGAFAFNLRDVGLRAMGQCQVCGKWCRLQGGRVTMPRHKALSERAWETHNR